MEEKIKHKSWQCPKCACHEYEKGQFAATSGKWFSKVFDIQNRKFATISCKNCHFTEIYKTSKSKLGDVLDFLIGS